MKLTQLQPYSAFLQYPEIYRKKRFSKLELAPGTNLD